jgi:hypothetical protein
MDVILQHSGIFRIPPSQLIGLQNQRPCPPVDTIMISNETNYNCLGVDMHRYDNVVRYKYALCRANMIIDLAKEIPASTQDHLYYFIIDCPGEDAFAHWVYESFIFLPLYLELKKKYPKIRIVTTNMKKYVNSFFKFFNIDLSQVTDTIDYTQENTCFFPPILTLSTKIPERIQHEEIFKTYIDKFAQSIRSRLVTLPQQNRLLFLPRNTVDNYAPNNNRVIPHSDEIGRAVIEMGGVSLNTYDINNMNFQFHMIYNSNTIILDSGSSVLVNSVFLEGKTILLLCSEGSDSFIHYMYHYSGIDDIMNYILGRNKVVLVNLCRPGFSFEEDILQYITVS